MRVFLIAGEPSGDRLGAALMAGLKELAPGVEFAGIGGAGMQAEGLESLFPMSELSVMGLVEILPKYFDLKARIRETARAALGFAPDVMITIDSPEFCLRVAKQVKAARAIRTVHYVAPSVWAWRPKRAVKMARVIDQVLALLPFEPPYMEAAGMRCDFVGHPVVSEPRADDTEVAAFRAANGIGEAPLVLVLPGSRRSEITRHGPIFGEVLGRLAQARPGLRAVLPMAQGVEDAARAAVAGWPVAPVLIPAGDAGAKRAAFRAADAALAVSGTVSLELAAAGTPMVIAYGMNPVNRFILARMLLIDTVTLVNLVSETRAVPEFLGPACTPERIVPALLDILADPGGQSGAMRLTMQRLGEGGEAPGLRAARAVLDGLADNRP
jgi:lipid-A-disaccharide synthase